MVLSFGFANPAFQSCSPAVLGKAHDISVLLQSWGVENRLNVAIVKYDPSGRQAGSLSRPFRVWDEDHLYDRDRGQRGSGFLPSAQLMMLARNNLRNQNAALPS